MARNPTLRARVAPAVLARLAACVEAHNARTEPGAVQIDQGDVVRLLLMRGLPGYEAELGIGPPHAPEPKTAKKTAKKTAAKRAK